MNIVIIARERSSRYPRKHLHPIRGVPLLWTMIRRIRNIGARPILCTGPEERNKSYVTVARWATADVYCEEEAPEWDLVTRFVNMARKMGIRYWIEQSGDCPFSDLSMAKDLWEIMDGSDYDHVGLPRPYATISGERTIAAKCVTWYEKADAFLAKDDRGREQPGVWCKDKVDHRSYSVEGVTDQSKTPIKTSIDWPLEAAITDLIVRYLGRWPETDEDIERAYREITVLNPEVDNTPPTIHVFNSKKGEKNPLVEGEEDFEKEER